MNIIPERLEKAQYFHLSSGSHTAIDDGACIMELVSWVAGEPWSDTPECACRVICAFMQSWNDCLQDDERNALLRPLIHRLIGTRSTKDIERRRAIMAADWLIREHTPGWLRLAGLTTQADALASLSEITDFLQCPSLMPTLEAVRKDANAAGAVSGTTGEAWSAAEIAAEVAGGAWSASGVAATAAATAAAWDAAGAAARAVGWDAARAAAWDAAGAAAWAVAWNAARAAAWDAAWAAAGAAAWAAARDAARAAAWSPLKPMCLALQQSALRLIDRMVECRE